MVERSPEILASEEKATTVCIVFVSAVKHRQCRSKARVRGKKEEKKKRGGGRGLYEGSATSAV